MQHRLPPAKFVRLAWALSLRFTARLRVPSCAPECALFAAWACRLPGYAGGVSGISAYLAFDSAALGLRYERQQVLSNNVANADTPAFKARDFRFAQALEAATGSDDGQPLRMEVSSMRDLPPDAETSPNALLYRVPFQPSLDGNTVDMNVERVELTDNALQYETSLALLKGKLSELSTAMQPVPGA